MASNKKQEKQGVSINIIKFDKRYNVTVDTIQCPVPKPVLNDGYFYMMVQYHSYHIDAEKIIIKRNGLQKSIDKLVSQEEPLTDAQEAELVALQNEILLADNAVEIITQAVKIKVADLVSSFPEIHSFAEIDNFAFAVAIFLRNVKTYGFDSDNNPRKVVFSYENAMTVNDFAEYVKMMYSNAGTKEFKSNAESKIKDFCKRAFGTHGGENSPYKEFGYGKLTWDYVKKNIVPRCKKKLSFDTKNGKGINDSFISPEEMISQLFFTCMLLSGMNAIDNSKNKTIAIVKAPENTGFSLPVKKQEPEGGLEPDTEK